jgi:hypothetical protein
MSNILLNPRFYGERYGRIQMFFAPAIGIAIMKEKITYINLPNSRPETYNVAAVIFGMELGMEYAITKKRNICVQTGISGLLLASRSSATDIYNPPFAEANINLIKCKLGLVWKLQKNML